MTWPASDEPEYGEKVVSWHTVWGLLYPDEAGDPHDDAGAAEMHRLRGLIVAQCAEIEAVLGMFIKRRFPQARIGRRTAGQLLNEIKRLLIVDHADTCESDLSLIDDAIDRRNRAVHSTVTVGSSWQPYHGVAGGDWIPVISFMNGVECDEADLRRDLALQQKATMAAVRLLHSREEPGT